MTWITSHWVEIAVVLVAGVQLGERIAALTASPEDDKWFSWIHKTLAAVGLKFPEPK